MKEGPLRALQSVNQGNAPAKSALSRLWCVWDNFDPQHELDIAATHNVFTVIIFTSYGRVIGLVDKLEELVDVAQSARIVAPIKFLNGVLDLLLHLLVVALFQGTIHSGVFDGFL